MLVYPTSISDRTNPIETQPRNDEPERGSCWNCKHMLECKLLGLRRTFCALKHHTDGDSEIEHITVPITNCADWLHFEA